MPTLNISGRAGCALSSISGGTVQRTRRRRPFGWIRWLRWARNTESSRWTNAMPDVRAPASRPAHIYAADHLALANHLGLGGCIGASFCPTLCELAPSRVTAAVLQNPIGHADNRDVFANLVQTWAKSVRAQRPEIDEHTLNRALATTCSAATLSTASAANSCASARPHYWSCRATTRRTRS